LDQSFLDISSDVLNRGLIPDGGDGTDGSGVRKVVTEIAKRIGLTLRPDER